MEILTTTQKKEARESAKRSRCQSIEQRVNELKSQGYQTYDAKQIAAQENGITIVHLYNLLKWYEREAEEKNK